MRLTIVASLLLLFLPHWCATPAPTQPTVVERPSERPAYAEAYFQAVTLEFQEGLSRALARVTGLGRKEALEITKIAHQESISRNIDVFRILGVIVAESHGHKEAISEKGALGLMQLMPQTGHLIAMTLSEPWRGKKSLFDIERNIRYGVWYYKDLLETFDGAERAALAAYNWGPGHVSQRIRQGEALPKDYPRRVLEAEERVRKEFWHENHNFIWRSRSRAKHIFSHRRDARQSQNRTYSSGLLGSVPARP